MKASSPGALLGSRTEPPANRLDWAIKRERLSVSGSYVVTLIELSSRLWISPLLIACRGLRTAKVANRRRSKARLRTDNGTLVSSLSFAGSMKGMSVKSSRTRLFNRLSKIVLLAIEVKGSALFH